MADKGLRFSTQFDDEWWVADLARSTPNGRKVAEVTRSGYESKGIFRKDVRPCEKEGPEGIDLERCFKVYLPPPIGRFGMVFRPEFVGHKIVFRYIAFGIRHHPRNSHAESVYQIAHRRLYGSDAQDHAAGSED
jgi:hypothetical protein